jgi:hypothetical protein
MIMDIKDLFILWVQQNNNNKIISRFKIVIFCFKYFEIFLQVDLWYIIVAL